MTWAAVRGGGGWLRVRPGDRVLLFPSYAFDFSVLELWISLLAGAAVVVPPLVAGCRGSSGGWCGPGAGDAC